MPLRLTKFEFDALKKRRSTKTPPATKFVNAGKRWEVEFAAQLDHAGLRYEREYRFKPDRRFRFDFAFPAEQIAVEIDGVVHRIKSRFNADREKGTIALLLGWRVLHVTSAQVRSGEALALLCQLICQSPEL
jgi:very-short-patch-repair endonuclease